MTDDTNNVKEKEAKSEEKSAKSNVSKNVEELVEKISKLSVLELSDLVNMLQNKLGVTAMPTAAPSAPTAAPASDSGAPAPQEQGGAQNLVMTASGENKIAVIKALREINQNLGLKEAKDMTEQLPAEIIKDGKPEEVKEAAEKLKTAGATVEMK